MMVALLYIKMIPIDVISKIVLYTGTQPYKIKGISMKYIAIPLALSTFISAPIYAMDNDEPSHINLPIFFVSNDALYNEVYGQPFHWPNTESDDDESFSAKSQDSLNNSILKMKPIITPGPENFPDEDEFMDYNSFIRNSNDEDYEKGLEDENNSSTTQDLLQFDSERCLEYMRCLRCLEYMAYMEAKQELEELQDMMARQEFQESKEQLPYISAEKFDRSQMRKGKLSYKAYDRWKHKNNKENHTRSHNHDNAQRHARIATMLNKNNATEDHNHTNHTHTKEYAQYLNHAPQHTLPSHTIKGANTTVIRSLSRMPEKSIASNDTTAQLASSLRRSSPRSSYSLDLMDSKTLQRALDYINIYLPKPHPQPQQQQQKAEGRIQEAVRVKVGGTCYVN